MSALEDATAAGAFETALGECETVIADFFTPSCVICRKIEPMLTAVAAESGGRLRALKVDAEANLELAAAYSVRGVPTLILFHKGEARDRKSGFVTASMLREWIRPYVART